MNAKWYQCYGSAITFIQRWYFITLRLEVKVLEKRTAHEEELRLSQSSRPNTAACRVIE
jgi:hypothetical protein